MTDEISSASSGASPAAGPGPGEFVAIWAESLAQVLGQIAGSPLAIGNLPEAPPDAPPRNENDLWLIAVAAGALRGEMSLRIAPASALALAQIFMGEPPADAAEFKPEHREAVEELLRQVAGHVATSVKPHWGEVQLRLEPGSAVSWSPGASGWLAGNAPIALEWQLSAALHAALLAPPAPPAGPPANPPVEAAAIHLPENTGMVEGNLDLLMDVELEVMLRFGERSMLLREILELGAGAVVELNRQVEEPAELLLDGRVIARGDVVVVDGNYGLRVLEVVPRQLAG